MQGASAAFVNQLLAENCQQQFGARLKCLDWSDMRVLTSVAQVLSLGGDVSLSGKNLCLSFQCQVLAGPGAAFTDTQRELP